MSYEEGNGEGQAKNGRSERGTERSVKQKDKRKESQFCLLATTLIEPVVFRRDLFVFHDLCFSKVLTHVYNGVFVDVLGCGLFLILCYCIYRVSEVDERMRRVGEK